ncbi:MAG: formylglycine-generating enzyme family protein [Desulfococcaceae bacterium]
MKIEAGEFWMGSDKNQDKDAYDDEIPQHRVTLSEYRMAKYPVTVAQFRAFVQDSGYTPEGEWEEDNRPLSKVISS